MWAKLSTLLDRPMKLDITSLGNAVRRLREGRDRYQREPADEQLRDGLIQRFEFTYELCHKMLRRYLKETAASPMKSTACRLPI